MTGTERANDHVVGAGAGVHDGGPQVPEEVKARDTGAVAQGGTRAHDGVINHLGEKNVETIASDDDAKIARAGTTMIRVGGTQNTSTPRSFQRRTTRIKGPFEVSRGRGRNFPTAITQTETIVLTLRNQSNRPLPTISHLHLPPPNTRQIPRPHIHPRWTNTSPPPTTLGLTSHNQA